MKKTQLSLWIEATEQCQIKCRFCYNPWRSINEQHHRHMSDEDVEHLISFSTRIANHYSPKYILAGGDATAHPRWKTILQRLASNGHVDLVTHGTTLSEDDIKFLREHDVDVQLSIPCLDGETYRYLTGGASLKNALVSLARLRHYGVPFSVSAVITSKNIRSLGTFSDFCDEVQPSYMILNKFIASGRGALYDSTLSVETDEFIAAVNEMEKPKNGKTRLLVSGHFKGVRHRKVKSPKITISTNGEIHLCSVASSRIGKVASADIGVLEEYERFWSSEETVPGCLCSEGA